MEQQNYQPPVAKIKEIDTQGVMATSFMGSTETMNLIDSLENPQEVQQVEW